MVDDSEFAVIFFLGSLYAFAIALLYALARAWEKSLSPVARPKPTSQSGDQNRGAVELQSRARRSSVIGARDSQIARD